MVFLKSIFIKIWSIKVYIYRLSGVYKQLTSPGDGFMLEKSGSATVDGTHSSKAKRSLSFIEQWLVTITAAGTVH